MVIDQAKIERAELAKQEAYWKQALHGDLPCFNFHDHPRPPAPSFLKKRESTNVNARLFQGLESFCLREGVKPSVVLLAVLNTLLLRYTDQEDLIIGSLFSDAVRERDGYGREYFTNPVALRMHLTGNTKVTDCLRQVAATVESAAEHRDYSFDQVIELTSGNRDLNRSPVFQVMCIFRDVRLCHTALPILDQHLLDVEEHITKCDLVLVISHCDEELRIDCEFGPELFERATITHLLNHFCNLLEGLISGPELTLSMLPLLTETERHQLLAQWNDTTRDFPKDQCIHQLFEAQAERTPDAVAVFFEDTQLSYHELNRRANRLAHYLRKLGVGPEVVAGMCLERSLDMVVGLMGILKAGGAYLPLDPNHPQERLALLLKDSQVSVLLTQQPLVGKIPPHDAKTVCLEADWIAIAHESGDNPPPTATADNLAYIVYTSGSTGKPKGTMIPHRGLVNYLVWCTRVYALTEGRGAPVHSSIGFDLTITSLFAPLLAGRSLVLMPRDNGIEALGAALRAARNFSFVKVTPAHLGLLNRQLSPETLGAWTRVLVVGGEPLSGENLSFWRTHAPKTRLINEYGPTETVVGCCAYEVPVGLSIPDAVPIGRPIANTRIYLLDSLLQPVPIGVTGELYVGGDGVARGYLNNPELTAEKFIPHPFGDKPGARLYRTGDLARYLPDGNIEFLGRADSQVKIRGFRIELGEIETVLTQHPAVRTAVVIVRDDASRAKRLIAYIVPDRQQTYTINDLHTFLKERLPDYMVPSGFVSLDALPLTANGKLDRRALTAPDVARPDLEQAFIEPRSPVEAALAQIWSEVLQVEKVGIHDNFFALGGHSLLAARLISRLFEAFSVRLSMRSLLEDPTVARLAEIIQRAKDGGEEHAAPPIAPVSRELHRVKSPVPPAPTTPKD